MKPSFTSIDWIDYLNLIYQKSIRIIIVCFAVAVVTAGITLLMDDYYKSTANLLPNDQRNIGMGLLQAGDGGGLGSLASTVLGGGQSEVISRFYVLLESRTTRKKVVNRFNLTEHYGTSKSSTPVKDAMQVLAENSTFEGKKEGNFIIKVWDRNPKMAKKIADYYVQRLNELNNEISTREAREYRKFIEKRYHKAQQQLDSLQQQLTKFQEKYGIYQLPQQVSSYFSLLASVTKKKIESEIKLKLLDKSVKKSSSSYQKALQQFNTIDSQLNELYNDQGSKDVILNFDRLPQVGARYFNLMRALEVQKKIQKTLVPLYEQAKMQQAKSLPIVTIVDEPVVPQQEDWPPRALIVILAAITTGIICLTYYMIRLSIRENRNYLDYIVHD